jgi:outer membrane murein-binding lipoprotein Lpp
MPAQFTPETRDDVTGWLWEGPFATLIREAIPGIAGTDLRRAREYLNACGMVVNVRAGQRGAQPQWFIRACWHQGPGGHVHVVTPARPGQAAAPAASQSVPGGPSETPAHQPGQDIAAALQSLARQVSELQADNDRLREDYDQLSAEIARIRALMRQIGGAIAEQASQLLAGAGD